MAITSFDITCKPPKSLCSTNSHKSNNVPCRMVKINFVSNSSATSTTNKSTKLKKNNSNSPYLKNDRVQLLSRVTEKRLVHKKTTDYISSFPLAANIYRANSDELNSLRRTNKKVKKSVLTLPNEPAPLPQVCTVSDMNDSEYQEHKNENNRCKVKKQPLPNRKIRVRNKGYEFYDRDARYCSQLNIDLDCSSTDIIDYNGDSKRHSKMNKCSKIKKQENDSQGHDVWAVLRNINRFQFQPSPPMSEESVLLKKKKGPKRRSNCKDTRVIETCHTEEFAYISSYELEGQSNNTFSQSSSLDRITVIDKQDDFSQMCDEFEKSITTSDLINNTCNQKRRNPTKNKNLNRNIKNVVKSRCNPSPKENCNRTVVLSKNKFKALKKKTCEKENCQNINNSDIISPKSNIISTTPVVNDDRIELLCSTHSGSSKAGFEVVSQNILKDPNSWLKASSDESTPQIIGISKVVLSKGYEKPVSKSYDMQKEIKKKPHLVTTMLSATLTPKLTQTEIKRRLSRIKFPVVILAKDEVSSGIEVVNYDPPHLDGLDKHIWPFMLEWDGNIKIKNEISAISERKLTSLEISRKCTPNISNYNDMKLRKNNNTKIEKLSNYTDRKYLRSEQVRNKIKVDDKAPTPFTSIGNKFQQYKKQKPILQLKERVLHLLYKKSNRSITKESLHSDEKKRVQSPFVNKVHMGTDVQLDYDDSASEDIRNLKHKYTSSLKSPPVIRPQNNVKQRWAKAKWASDFIENVIRKIKNGAYYTHENKDIRRKYKTGIKEMSIQTIPNHKHYLNPPSHEINEQTEDPFKIISECDNTLSAVEIKTFNRNQIAIKHCVTNVMVQFDVSIPTETAQIIVNAKRSSSLIPLEVTASHTKIYKSKTKIVNGVLPAELCSILPKMIRNILEAKPKLTQETMPSIVFDKSDSQLTIISELSRSESPDFLVGFPLSSGMLPELRKTFEGAFSKEINKFKCLPINTFRKTDYKSNVIISLLPKISFNDMLSSELNIKIPRIIRNRNTLVGQMKDLNNLHKPKRTSSALVTYTVSQHNLKPTYKRYDLMSMIENMTCHNNFQDLINSIHSINNLTLQYDGRNLKVNMFIRNKRGIDENTTLIINNSPFNAELKTNYEERPITGNMFLNEINCIGDNHIMPVKKLEGKESKGQLIVALNKGRKKGFVKLYKKCKSTSNIFNGDKLSNTPLSKISSLDDFFQVLGSNKSLSSMFDGYTGKKILSSLKEMNNWTTDINPRQAMLVLLLTNKKDTGNLVRFRPILLQGIAVNRITRATELDMEIEVIERENFNKLSQYEGVSYSLESVVNHDNLLEELCWIAKTTASDYQRPFDDSSERLLKSLLEKRKKLNPSYLRVMARYVGLGLLKSPLKK